MKITQHFHIISLLLNQSVNFHTIHTYHNQVTSNRDFKSKHQGNEYLPRLQVFIINRIARAVFIHSSAKFKSQVPAKEEPHLKHLVTKSHLLCPHEYSSLFIECKG
jgi:hypothetical protein